MPTYPNQPWDPLADAVMRDGPLTTAERIEKLKLEKETANRIANSFSVLRYAEDREAQKAPAVKWSDTDKLKMRLDMPIGADWGRHMQVAIMRGANRVFIFVVKDDKTMLFEDDVHLYPSDSLVGQFRLFLEAV